MYEYILFSNNVLYVKAMMEASSLEQIETARSSVAKRPSRARGSRQRGAEDEDEEGERVPEEGAFVDSFPQAGAFMRQFKRGGLPEGAPLDHQHYPRPETCLFNVVRRILSVRSLLLLSVSLFVSLVSVQLTFHR